MIVPQREAASPRTARRSPAGRTAVALIAVAASLTAPSAARAEGLPGGLMRYPDVSADSIVFLYADDLWLAPRTGGVATPLASAAGAEQSPHFAPDGETIAFTGNYDGNRDVYIVPVGGGIPRRVTHHPAAEIVCDVTPDGDILFASNGLAPLGRMHQLFRVGPEGGLPERLPIPYGYCGAISPDGRKLAYTPHTRDQRTWKRYRGGMATDIWIYDLAGGTARRITDWEGTDTQPMWHGETVYYLSDAGREHRLNVWAYDTRRKRRRQVTHFSDHDIKYASIGPGPDGGGEIVFQAGAALYLLDLTTGAVDDVAIEVPGARATLRRRTYDAAERIVQWSLAPDGKRAVVEARGDIWTVPAEHGAPRNLTRTDDAAERDPAWSPDGRWVAYFSDASGEYELWIAPADGKGDARRLTTDGAVFRSAPSWSPDAKRIAFHDTTGAIWVHDVAGETTRRIDTDPVPPLTPRGPLNWSHDSRFLAYHRTDDEGYLTRIYIYDVENDQARAVTSPMFASANPVFDRKGDHLFFRTSREFRPIYSDLDTSWVYAGTQILVAVPLRAEAASPFAPVSDEVSVAASKDDGGDQDEDDGDANGEKGKESDDGLSGVWEGTVRGIPDAPPEGVAFTLTISLGADGALSGAVSVLDGSAEIVAGSFDRENGRLELELSDEDGISWTLTATVSGDTMTGTATSSVGLVAEFSAERTSREAPSVAAEEAGKPSGKKKGKREKVAIDFDGFERRAVRIPVPAGRFGALEVNDRGQLIFARFPLDPSGKPSIQLFDLGDDKREAKDVVKGSGAFTLSADGKKMLALIGGRAQILDARPGATPKPVPTGGMLVAVDPADEWRQIFTDAWRMMRDFFYDPNMHGVDWEAVRDHYAAMLDDCVTRSDVAVVIREMIAELNVGHAYYGGPPPEGPEPRVPVGMLGVDFAEEQGAYRITRIYGGAEWDVDARGPLGEPGVDVHEGDWLLAVNRVPVDPDADPWAALEGLAGKSVPITVSAKPVLDDEAREVVVTLSSSERALRYRAWIERNRRRVDEASGGRIGYIYVPDTGVNGQNDLVRQYFGQIHKPGLIIDERWNGGGQIPTRFIELLDRPLTNYWARRHGRDWPWPPDGHHGPKAMLINGLAGSGGDAFPYYFRQRGLGKLIGTRTWGGLVGIPGGPRLIDGAVVTFPSFAFYEKDGTWGVEGHGVDPDIEVVDDPSAMRDGADPQLERAIEELLAELKRNPPRPPKRPPYPDRSGMGLPARDR